MENLLTKFGDPGLICPKANQAMLTLKKVHELAEPYIRLEDHI